MGGVPRVGAAAFDTGTGALLPWDLQLTQGFGDVLLSGFGVGPPPTDTTLYVGGIFETVRGVPRPSGSAEVTLADPVTGEGGEPTDWTTTFGLGRPIVAEDVIWSNALGGVPLFTISRATGAATGFLGDSPYRSSTAIALDSTGGPEGQGVIYLAAERDFPGDPFPSQYLVAIDAETKQILPDYFEEGALRVAKERGRIGVRSLAVGLEGDLFAGGNDLYSVGRSEARRFLAGIDLTTGRVTPFNEDFVIFSSVESVAASPDERFLYFRTFNGLGVADLETGVLMDFPGNERFSEAAEEDDTGADSTAGLVRRAGPVVARADGSHAPRFAPPSAVPTASGGQERFRTNGSALVASDERLYLHGGGAAVAYDRFSGDVLWTTELDGFGGGPNTDELLLVVAGPASAAGDTLFLSGGIRAAGGEPRDEFAALDAETGAVLAWNVNPTAPSNGFGAALAALGPPTDGDSSADEARIYLSGSGLDTIGGEPRRNLAAAERATGEILGWVAQPEPGEVPGGVALAAQAGPDGGASGGVIYSGAEAYDAESGALLAWDPALTGGAGFGGGAFSILVSERQERVILAGTFVNSLRGSGHAFVTALTPARPFAPPVSAEDDASAPQTAALSAAHPNPFRGAATVTLALPEAQRVEVALFDVLGRRVAVLHDGPLASGTHALTLDGAGLPSGVYVVRAQSERFTASRRVTVVR